MSKLSAHAVLFSLYTLLVLGAPAQADYVPDKFIDEAPPPPQELYDYPEYKDLDEQAFLRMRPTPGNRPPQGCKIKFEYISFNDLSTLYFKTSYCYYKEYGSYRLAYLDNQGIWWVDPPYEY